MRPPCRILAQQGMADLLWKVFSGKSPARSLQTYTHGSPACAQSIRTSLKWCYAPKQPFSRSIPQGNAWLMKSQAASPMWAHVCQGGRGMAIPACEPGSPLYSTPGQNHSVWDECAFGENHGSFLIVQLGDV